MDVQMSLYTNVLNSPKESKNKIYFPLFKEIKSFNKYLKIPGY